MNWLRLWTIAAETLGCFERRQAVRAVLQIGSFFPTLRALADLR